MPLFLGITAVTRKKINNKNAMSAIDPAFTSGLDFVRLMMFLFVLMAVEIQKRYHIAIVFYFLIGVRYFKDYLGTILV
jgi:hypothetical protein